jgi:tetratricopeptide (TPR) repeat protein
LERLFVARRPLFTRLYAEITSQEPQTVPSHQLLIGQRGMGKTTMLARLALELRKERQDFLPLSFWEEQHIEVDRLSVFWLNCLDSYADSLDQAGEKAAAQALDARIQAIQVIKPEDDCARAAREALTEVIQQESRRLVLFIDNFNLLLARLKEHDHVLRGFFTRHGAPIIIGAAITPPADLSDYDAAFYDGFKTTLLDRLSLEETKDMILRLAEENGQSDTVKNLWRHLPRLSALRDLSGGNPRTSLLIYRLCAQGFGKDVYKDLESLLDETTPLFQSRFEQLSEQGQKLVARLARHWRAATAEKITELTGFPRSTVSPLLGRLEEEGVIEKTPLFDPGQRSSASTRKPGLSKKTGYRLSERFFNIWLIMRSASRRERAGIICLARFLESIYTPEELDGHARSLGGKSTLDLSEAITARALAEVFMSDGGQHDLRIRAETTLLEFARRGTQDLEGLIDAEAIDTKVYEHVELKERLKAAVPPTAKTTPEEFAGLVLGSISRLVPDGQANWVIAALKNKGRLDIDKVVQSFREEADDFDKHLGTEAFSWLQKRLQNGLWRDAKNQDEAQRAIDSAPNGPALAAIGGIIQNQLPELSISAYTKALERDETIFDTWFGLGILHHQAGRKHEARAAYQRAVAIQDNWLSLCSNYGQLLAVEFGELSEAEKWLRKASNLDPRDPVIANNLAACLWFQGGKERAEEAISHFRRVGALKLNEPDPQPWINIGNIYELVLKDYASAETSYRKAISMTSLKARSRTLLGDLLLHQLNDPKAAEDQLRQACAEDGPNSACWISLGFLLAEHDKDFLGAEDAFRRAISKDEPARAWYAYGEMLMKHLNRLPEAEEAFREALRAEPDSGVAWHGLGWLQAGYLFQPEEARKSLEKAVNCSPKVAGYRSSLGNIEFDLFNNLDAAELHFQKALELSPEEDLARHNYAFLLRDHRCDIAAAKALLISLRQPELWLDTQALHETLFAVYEQNWGQAQEALRKALAVIGYNEFPKNTQDDWYRASAVLLHIGYGQPLLDFLKAEGQDECRMPWFEALQAHVIGDRQYLLNIPAEAQEVAGTIFDQIARRRAFLPKHTMKK